MKRFALITVSDKAGVEILAVELEKLGFTILSTSGTARFLRQFCHDVIEVSEVTGFPEILSGRVRTLHPAIHAGILGDRDKAEHMRVLDEKGIDRIDLVAVNLYPFEQTRRKDGVTEAEIIENIDIGGPALIRAAAKNHRGVIVLTDPSDYEPVLAALKEQQDLPLEQRRELARKAFALVSSYDAGIERYLAGEPADAEKTESLPAEFALRGKLAMPLRYGENPHQAGGFYTNGPSGWQVLHGKELSFNNLQDLDASLRALALFAEPTAVIVKHCNPCGIGSAQALSEAYQKAFAADTESPYGGIVSLNRPLDLATAELINQVFTEIVIAPEYEPGVLDFLSRKKNRRLIDYESATLLQNANPWELKMLLGGFLLQDWDRVDEPVSSWRIVTKRQPNEQETLALQFGWKVVSLLRSNAIALTGPDRVFGLGSGQTSRLDATHLAVWKAGKFRHELSQAVCASDGFFPFADSVEELHRHGVRAIIQPGGSKGDAAVIQACDERGIAMVCTGFRHFRH